MTNTSSYAVSELSTMDYGPYSSQAISQTELNMETRDTRVGTISLPAYGATRTHLNPVASLPATHVYINEASQGLEHSSLPAACHVSKHKI